MLRTGPFEIWHDCILPQSGESIIIFGGADVELEVAAEASAEGGVKFWVVNAGVGGTYTRTAKITVHVYSGEQEFGVGK
jgi:hypothetical protein